MATSTIFLPKSHNPIIIMRKPLDNWRLPTKYLTKIPNSSKLLSKSSKRYSLEKLLEKLGDLKAKYNAGPWMGSWNRKKTLGKS